MVARILHRTGVHFGPEEEMIAAHESNQFGHFEDKRFVNLNDDLLVFLGGGWDQPPVLLPGWELQGELEPYRSRARDLLRNHDLRSGNTNAVTLGAHRRVEIRDKFFQRGVKTSNIHTRSTKHSLWKETDSAHPYSSKDSTGRH